MFDRTPTPLHMKRLLVLTTAIVTGMAGNAQVAPAIAAAVFSPKRIVKTNLAGYALLVVNAHYEQKVGPKTSVGLMAGYKLPQTIRVDAVGRIDGESQRYTGDIEPQGVYVNPYFRFYPKEAFKGFYLEGFARYFRYTYGVPYDYDKNGRNIRAALDGRASAAGGGLGLGIQLSLASRLFLDINAGYGMAVGSAHVETSDPNLDRADYEKIKRNIERYQDDPDVQVFLLGDFLKNPDARATDTSAEADFKNKLFPIVRGGISLGYAF